MPRDRWEGASAYDRFMGRWSRELGLQFVFWLQVPPGASWFELGCGTGSLTSAICEHGQPASVLACDASPDFVAYCREHLRYPQLTVVDATSGLVTATGSSYDVIVSSLVLNFLPAPLEALAQMRSACSLNGCVAACVWDYAEGMEFLRLFWDAAVALDPGAANLHEGHRFPLCNPEALRSVFEAAGLHAVSIVPISVATNFASFADF